MGKAIKKNRKTGQTVFLFCILIVPVIQWLIFWLYVNLDSVLLAFKDARTDEWTLNNFITFWEGLTSPYGAIGVAAKNTGRYFLNQLLITFLALCVSYFFYKKILGYKTFRVVFYLPSIISSVAIVTAFKSFINPGGPLDLLLKLFGKQMQPEGLLANPDTATPTIMAYCVWAGMTTNVLLFSSAMNRVPVEVLESAILDGCGPIRELFQLILPMIWSSISSVLILVFTGLISSTGPILLFTNGLYDTTTISFWIFNMVYGDGALGGTASAYNIVSCAGFCFTAVSVPIILGVRKLFDLIPSVEY